MGASVTPPHSLTNIPGQCCSQGGRAGNRVSWPVLAELRNRLEGRRPWGLALTRASAEDPGGAPSPLRLPGPLARLGGACRQLPGHTPAAAASLPSGLCPQGPVSQPQCGLRGWGVLLPRLTWKPSKVPGGEQKPLCPARAGQQPGVRLGPWEGRLLSRGAQVAPGSEPPPASPPPAAALQTQDPDSPGRPHVEAALRPLAQAPRPARQSRAPCGGLGRSGLPTPRRTGAPPPTSNVHALAGASCRNPAPLAPLGHQGWPLTALPQAWLPRPPRAAAPTASARAATLAPQLLTKLACCPWAR